MVGSGSFIDPESLQRMRKDEQQKLCVAFKSNSADAGACQTLQIPVELAARFQVKQPRARES